MIKTLSKEDVVVKINEDNTVTIMRDCPPSRNNSRVFKQPEIVVSYFSIADLERLREIQITPINNKNKSNIFFEYLERSFKKISKKK